MTHLKVVQVLNFKNAYLFSNRKTNIYLIVGYLNTEKYKGSNKTTTEILLNLIFSSCVS